MLSVNIQRDRALVERGDQVDGEAEKRYAEERGMLDQTEVGLSLAIFRSEGMWNWFVIYLSLKTRLCDMYFEESSISDW